ncbi:MAG: type III pantothenate kinase [Ignavibacteria bacterium]|nr:type III pantothenate kinase [Ignavibacteria bacterium]
MQNNLLIDIGNSHIKAAIGLRDASLKNIKKIEYEKEYQSEKLNDIISTFVNKNKDIYKITKVGISLLDLKIRSAIIDLVKIYFSSSPVFINKKIKLPIKIKYSSTLGSDRICSTVGAYYKYRKRKKILIIDFGTATTYNLLINGVFEGGMITPGVETSLQSLINKTSLPKVKIDSKVKLITNDTVNNIKSGIWFQNLFTVERIIQEIKKKHKNLFVIATGGLSHLIYDKTELINKLEKNLVLEGINYILDQE